MEVDMLYHIFLKFWLDSPTMSDITGKTINFVYGVDVLLNTLKLWKFSALNWKYVEFKHIAIPSQNASIVRLLNSFVSFHLFFIQSIIMLVGIFMFNDGPSRDIMQWFLGCFLMKSQTSQIFFIACFYLAIISDGILLRHLDSVIL